MGANATSVLLHHSGIPLLSTFNHLLEECLCSNGCRFGQDTLLRGHGPILRQFSLVLLFARPPC